MRRHLVTGRRHVIEGQRVLEGSRALARLGVVLWQSEIVQSLKNKKASKIQCEF
jgi:hypothetical protein